MRHAPILARCAYGENRVAAVAAQFGFVSLFNDSSAAQVLAVYDYGYNSSFSTQLTGFVVAQGKVGSSPIQGSAVYTSQGTMPGQVSVGTVATLPTFNFLPSGGFNQMGWAHEFALIVLAPGWSITGYAGNPNLLFELYFWYEWMYPAQLLNPDIGPEHIHHDRGY